MAHFKYVTLEKPVWIAENVEFYFIMLAIEFLKIKAIVLLLLICLW